MSPFHRLKRGYSGNFKGSGYARSYEVRQMDDLKWLEPIWDMISNGSMSTRYISETHRDMVIVDEKRWRK